MIEDFLEHSPAGYFSFFDDGTLYTVNQTLCDLLGYSKEELRIKNVELIFTLSTRIFYQTHFFPLVKLHGAADEIFLTLLTKDNQHLPVLLNAKTHEEPVVYTSCAFIVVPNRRKFEDELIQARNVAQKALQENTELLKARADLQQHSEELDRQIQTVKKQNHELQQLHYAVTHNLKEPIRKILVYTEKMQLEDIPDDLKPTVDRLWRSSEQMRTIVAGLQQYIWLVSSNNRFSSIDLKGLVKKIAARFRQDSNEDLLQLTVGELPIIEADIEQMEVLIYQIFSNAVNFRRQGKALVTVTGNVVKQNSFRATPDKYKYEDFLRLEIRDEGIGFDPAYRDSIFELFRKLHYAGGRGLGLALCKKIVENHSGIIEAYSKPNHFTVITVSLPLIQADET